jgi:putative lipoprotein
MSSRTRRLRLLVAALATALACACATRPARAEDPDPDPWLGTDKALHFGISAGIAAGGYTAGAAAFEARYPALLVGGGVALAAGAGKELADMAGAGTPSWRDFAWDVAGTLVGLAVAWSADLAIRGTGPSHPPLAAPTASHASGLRIAF